MIGYYYLIVKVFIFKAINKDDENFFLIYFAKSLVVKITVVSLQPLPKGSEKVRKNIGFSEYNLKKVRFKN
jgi:hypothetical protein